MGAAASCALDAGINESSTAGDLKLFISRLSEESKSKLRTALLPQVDEDSAPPILHLFPASQPSRSVEMLLNMGGVPFKNVQVNVMAGEKCAPNPMGTVPLTQTATARLRPQSSVRIWCDWRRRRTALCSATVFMEATAMSFLTASI